jgi:hypothetical protein
MPQLKKFNKSISVLITLSVLFGAAAIPASAATTELPPVKKRLKKQKSKISQ